jgi:AcrR family transcriptional regulator
MAPLRRVGAESSKTRGVLLDVTEQLMLDDGYAAVTYRSVAAGAGVTAGLVQYYFPTLDDLFLALLRRRSDANHERLLSALDQRPDEPLRVVWEFNTDEASSALMMELLALANHRKSIRAEIAELTHRSRNAQHDALVSRWPQYGAAVGPLSPNSLLFLMATIPKMILLEDSVGISDAHDEILRLATSYLDSVEPTARRRRDPARKPGRPRSAPKKEAGRPGSR